MNCPLTMLTNVTCLLLDSHMRLLGIACIKVQTSNSQCPESMGNSILNKVNHSRFLNARYA